MLTIEEIKEIVKKEFHINLEQYETDETYMSKSDLFYASKVRNDKEWYVSLEKTSKMKQNLTLTHHHITTIKELKSLIRKFKKLRKMI